MKTRYSPRVPKPVSSWKPPTKRKAPQAARDLHPTLWSRGLKSALEVPDCHDRSPLNTPECTNLAEILINFGFLRDDVYCAARCDRSVKNCARATNDFKALDRVAGRVAKMDETIAEELSRVESADALVVSSCMELQSISAATATENLPVPQT